MLSATRSATPMNDCLRPSALLPLLVLSACFQPTVMAGDPEDAGPSRDAASTSDAGSGLDASSLPDVGCGDPAAKARFPACREEKTEAGCTQAGGVWASGPEGFSFCSCPTGEGGCVCSSGAQCLTSDCIAPIPGGGFDACKDVESGTCAEYSPMLGCVCTFELGAPPTWLCRD